MLTQDGLTKALHEGAKAADACSCWCRIGAECEADAYLAWHNGRSDADTEVQKVYAPPAPSLAESQMTVRFWAWLKAAGSTANNRGQAARVASSSHRGRLPRRLGATPGTGKVRSSCSDQRRSVKPAA